MRMIEELTGMDVWAEVGRRIEQNAESLRELLLEAETIRVPLSTDPPLTKYAPDSVDYATVACARDLAEMVRLREILRTVLMELVHTTT